MAKLSFPSDYLPKRQFRWWLEATAINASGEWRQRLPYTAIVDETEFPP